LLHVHPSNFRVTGFTESVSIADLTMLAHRHGVPVIDDIGSGCLLDLAPFGIATEPRVQDSIEAGADVVCFSGDKLLGGPQSGIVVGGADFIARIRRHALMRTVRVDKITLAGLHATLLHYLRNEAPEKIPVWQMIAAPLESLRQRAGAWLDTLQGIPGCRLALQDGQSTIGGGTTPGESIATCILSIRPIGTSRGWASHVATELRHTRTPVLGRVEDGALLIDPRTVLPSQDISVGEALRTALSVRA
jgi:L-seryl-tRNA(Ser) seleniumtransferase